MFLIFEFQGSQSSNSLLSIFFLFIQDGPGHGARNTLEMGMSQLWIWTKIQPLRCPFPLHFYTLETYTVVSMNQQSAQVWQEHNRRKLGHSCWWRNLLRVSHTSNLKHGHNYLIFQITCSTYHGLLHVSILLHS